jgi:hypothetical protein
LRLQHLAGTSANLGIGRDATGKVEARRVVVGLKASNNKVWEQWLIVKW